MLSTPELRQRAVVTAPCLPLTGSLVLAQTRPQRQQSDASLPVNACRITQQSLPAVVLMTLEGGCFGSDFFVTNDLIATNKHMLDCGGRGAVRIAGNQHTFPITTSWSYHQHDLAIVHVVIADTKPPALSTQSVPALVHITEECLVAENRRCDE